MTAGAINARLWAWKALLYARLLRVAIRLYGLRFRLQFFRFSGAVLDGAFVLFKAYRYLVRFMVSVFHEPK